MIEVYWSSACGNFAHIYIYMYTHDLLHVDTETLHIDVYMPVKMQKNNSPPCLSFLCTSPPVSLDIPLGHLALQQPSELRSGQAIRLAPNLSGAFAIMKNEPFPARSHSAILSKPAVARHAKQGGCGTGLLTSHEKSYLVQCHVSVVV